MEWNKFSVGPKFTTTEINRIDVGDNSCTTPLEISNALNYHFTHIGPRLADNISKLVFVSRTTLRQQILVLR